MNSNDTKIWGKFSKVVRPAAQLPLISYQRAPLTHGRGDCGDKPGKAYERVPVRPLASVKALRTLP